jgi:integrase
VVIKKPLVLNDAQLDHLLDTISGHRLEDIVLIALATGARIGEVLGLLWANIDYDARELHITGAVKRNQHEKPGGGFTYEVIRDRFTKTKDERTQHLPDSVAAVFRRCWERQQQARREAGKAWKEQGLVFTDDRGGPLNPNTIGNAFTHLARQSGLPPGFSPHNLRHSATSFLIKQGEHEHTIMQVLGHRNPRTTARYGLVLEEVSRDALDKHAERLSRQRGAK